MTDIMLRKECVDLSFELPGIYLGKDIDKLMAFARRMQAKGLREAAKIARDRATRARSNGELRQVYFLRKDEAEWITSHLEDEATTRERNHGA